MVPFIFWCIIIIFGVKKKGSPVVVALVNLSMFSYPVQPYVAHKGFMDIVVGHAKGH
jgi:hypothetical protein